jgi:hypothetical protein
MGDLSESHHNRQSLNILKNKSSKILKTCWVWRGDGEQKSQNCIGYQQLKKQKTNNQKAINISTSKILNVIKIKNTKL